MRKKSCKREALNPLGFADSWHEEEEKEIKMKKKVDWLFYIFGAIVSGELLY